MDEGNFLLKKELRSNPRGEKNFFGKKEMA